MCTGTYHGNWLRLGAKTPFARVRKSPNTVSLITRSARMSLHAAANTIGRGGQRASQQEKPLQATQLDGPFSFTGSAVHLSHRRQGISRELFFALERGKSVDATATWISRMRALTRHSLACRVAVLRFHLCVLPRVFLFSLKLIHSGRLSFVHFMLGGSEL